jgi:hypothetical protein
MHSARKLKSLTTKAIFFTFKLYSLLQEEEKSDNTAQHDIAAIFALRPAVVAFR